MSNEAPSGVGRSAQSAIFRAGIGGTAPQVPVDPSVLFDAARRALSKEAAAYIFGGAGVERTMAANRAAFDDWQVWPRPLTDVSMRNLETTAFGVTRPTPFILAPLGVMEMVHPEADLAVARAAVTAQMPYVLSNQASFPMEDVAAEAPAGERWFQLYWSASDELNESLVTRAEGSGCTAIVITVDTHLLGWRTRDLDLGYLPFTRAMGIAQYLTDPVFKRLVAARVAEPQGQRAAVKITPKAVLAGISIARKGESLTGAGLRDSLKSPLPRAAVETFLDVFSTPALTWGDIVRVREWTSLPIIIKGIVHPDDAVRARDVGVNGVWISNHGGRQIDASVPTLYVLPEIVARVGGDVEVIFDSGVRGGADALIALALGASLVAIGRPYAAGLALAGEDGVREVLRNHLAELDITMGLAGRTRISDLDPTVLRHRGRAD
ncbi:alpha-hydroxy-acid oxidizing protein [Microbacterium sp. NC79]|uniref:alpha-hydroxy-acid oxidizing protein n=1 Tax=Microbacterium sp. NC79 TaxID=2851009 RepID=UPI001C2C0149|nr:alpha-hydroxy-acid oxidizing protein [Microbacterium sp. NC79]MBV0895843.1 alpha-hydroxy-acid oxidizing protein [Microbacterium sp. NC79]